VPTDTQPLGRVLIRLLGYCRPYLPFVALTLSFSILYALGLSSRVLLIQPLLDDVAIPSLSLDTLGGALESGLPEGVGPAQIEEDRRALRERLGQTWTFLIWAALGLILGMPAVRWVRDYTGEWVMTRMLTDMQAEVGSKLLRLPLARHVREQRGEFVSRTLFDTNQANRAQALVFGEAVQDVAIVLMAMVGAFVLNWRLALVTVAVAPPIALVMSTFGQRIRRASRARQEQVAEVVQRLSQILGGIKVIKAFRAERHEQALFSQEVARYFRRSMRAIRNRVLSRSLVEMVTQAGFVLLLFVGVYAVLQSFWSLTVGQLAAFLGLSAMQYRPLKNFTRLYNTVQDSLPAAERLFELIDDTEETQDDRGTVELRRVAQGIAFRDVWFRYADEPVLRGVDLEIPAGEVVALVGRTGVGKTTLADLLLRFYDPDRGRVEIDGHDIADIRRDSLRDLIAVVTQETHLFSATVLENIRYGRRDAEFEEVIEAARAANAHDFIEKLPQGYDTELGEFGGRLSGGERQRITIARALLADPQILIFDEATSALDATSERLVQEAIGNLMKGRTVLMIAHRLSTLRAAHRIIVLEEGRVTLSGTHDELYQRDGLYRELADLQLSSPSSSS
jgi:subfamily B ATP-binding cassette protein MsbA